MQLHRDVITTPPVASATVVLLRDNPPHGLEVFLLRRHTASAVLGGVYVFPGGKLDPADCAPALQAHLMDDAQSLCQRLGEPDLAHHLAAGLYVSAVREVLEECGVLLARCVDAPSMAVAALQRQQWQHQLHQGASFLSVLQHGGLRVDTQHLVPWSRWITPRVPAVTQRRFDTRFFVATLPEGQMPMHDNIEATDSLWLSPLQALTRYWAGDLPLAPPQIMTLVSLLSHSCTHSVLNYAQQQTPPLIEPESIEEQGVRIFCYPGHARHTVAQRAMPGPSCLRLVAGRFEPMGGFQEFL